MPTKVGNLVVEMSANVARLQRDFDKATTSAKRTAAKIKSSLSIVGSGLVGYASVQGLTRLLGDMLDAAKAGEVSQRRLAAVLKATGYAAGVSAGEVEKLAQNLARTTALADEPIRDAAATMLSFRNVTKDTFEDALKAAIDLSEFMGTDLQGAVVQVGKALNDPKLGISALSRVGVTFSPEQKKLIATMLESNRVADAQRVIIKELQSEFGGTAEAMNTGINKSTNDLRKAWVDLLEAMGRTEAVGGNVSAFYEGLSIQIKDLESDILRSRNAGEAMLRVLGKFPTAGAVGLQSYIASKLIPQGKTEFEKSLARGGQTGPIDWSTYGGGTEDPGGGDVVAESITKVVEALKFEQQQLKRTETEQRVYKELRAAGVSINSDFGKSIAKMVRQIEGEKDAQDAAKKAAEEHQKALEKLAEEHEQDVLRMIDNQDALAASAAMIYEETRTPFEKYQAAVKNLQFFRDTKGIDEDTYRRAFIKLSADYTATVDGMNDKTGELSEFMVQAFRNMETAASDFFFNVLEGNFDDLGASFRRMVNKMLADWMAVKTMGALFGDTFSSTGNLGGLLGAGLGMIGNVFSSGASAAASTATSSVGSSWTDSFGLSLSGGRAVGGTVLAGKGYLVGENGPEPFFPQTSGVIVPNGASGGIGGTSITIPIGNIDGGNKQLIAMLPEYIKNGVREAIRDYA